MKINGLRDINTVTAELEIAESKEKELLNQETSSSELREVQANIKQLFDEIQHLENLSAGLQTAEQRKAQEDMRISQAKTLVSLRDIEPDEVPGISQAIVDLLGSIQDTDNNTQKYTTLQSILIAPLQTLMEDVRLAEATTGENVEVVVSVNILKPMVAYMQKLAKELEDVKKASA